MQNIGFSQIRPVTYYSQMKSIISADLWNKRLSYTISQEVPLKHPICYTVHSDTLRLLPDIHC